MSINTLRNAQSQNPRPSSVLQSLQTPLHASKKTQVLEAIERLGLKVTPGTIAAETGLPVLVSTSLLNQIAYETQGQLQVSDKGDITYSFAPNFQYQYVIDSSKNAIKGAYRIAINLLSITIKLLTAAIVTITRIGICVLLVVSVIVVIALITAVIIGAIAKLFGGDGDSGGDLGDLGGALDFSWAGDGMRFCFDWMWDWRTWNLFDTPYSWSSSDSYWYENNYGPWYGSASSSRAVGARPCIAQNDYEVLESQRRKDERSFVDSCCAMLLGAGNPNQQLQVQHWSIIAQVIKSKCGTVIAEDLAPYMEIGNRPNEDWMLPVLIRFNGSAEVSPSGKLIYCFPTLAPEPLAAQPQEAQSEQPADNANISSQLNALYRSHLTRKRVSQSAEHGTRSLPPYLELKSWDICGLTESEATSVLWFAIIASFGAFGLMHFAGHVALIHKLQWLLTIIGVYGALFLIAPAIRMLWIAPKNHAISKENDRRTHAAGDLQRPDRQLKKHLDEAADLRASFWQSETGVVYTTERDLLEQSFAR